MKTNYLPFIQVWYSLRTNNCEHLIMKATVDEHISIQVEKAVHEALQSGTQVRNIGLKVAAKVGAKSAAKVGIKAATKAGTKVTTKVATNAGAYGTADAAEAGAEALFQLGYRAALSGTAIGIAVGAAFAVNLLVEGPLLARAIYKLYRKKKFDQISDVEMKRSIIQESITTANTVAGAVGGAALGQITIPVPVLGAALGAVVGGIVGQTCGRAEGWAARSIIKEPRHLTIPPLIKTSLVDNSQPCTN